MIALFVCLLFALLCGVVGKLKKITTCMVGSCVLRPGDELVHPPERIVLKVLSTGMELQLDGVTKWAAMADGAVMDCGLSPTGRFSCRNAKSLDVWSLAESYPPYSALFGFFFF